MDEKLYTYTDEILYTYTDTRGYHCGFVLKPESQEVSDIIWETVGKILYFMQQNGTVVDYSGNRSRNKGEKL